MRIGKVIGWILLAVPLSAADFQVTASLDRQQVAVGDPAMLSIVVSGNVSHLPPLQLPGLADFQIAQAGTSQNFSWINGQASASITYNFALTPLKEGHFTIPPIRVTLGGQSEQTQAMALDVVKGNPAAVPEGGARQFGNPVEHRSGADALFIQGSVDRTSVYVGEPVVYTFRLYNRVPLMSQPRYQPPETGGFWAEDLPPQRNYQSVVKGIPYNVTEVKTALFPTAAGKARVGSAALSVTIENIGSDPFSDQFFSQFFGRGEEKTLRTEPLSISVKPLPEPKPAGFKGAVGRYTLSATLDKDRTTVGQPLTLTLTISGQGNIKSLPDLNLPTISNFRTFDANAATNIDKKNYQVSGSKVFKTVLIPTTSGDLTIPSVSFAFFDPEARRYKTVNSRPLTVHVAAGAGNASGSNVGAGSAAPNSEVSASAPGGPGIQRLSEDIRYIKTPSSISSQGKPLYRQSWYQWLHGILLALLAGLGLFRLYQVLFLSNKALTRFRTAKERVDAAIQKAEESLQKNEIRPAADVLSDALQTYIADKLAIDSHGVALKQVMNDLRTHGVTPHDTEKVRNLWEQLDLYQFAPAQVRPEEVRQTMRTFEHVIEEMEREIQWKA